MTSKPRLTSHCVYWSWYQFIVCDTKKCVAIATALYINSLSVIIVVSNENHEVKDDFMLFFWKEIDHLGSDDLFFFFGLHFTVVGKNLGNRAGVSNLLNHLPPTSKTGKKWSIFQNHPPNAQHRFAPLIATILE